MKTKTEEISREVEQLAGAARGLLDATTDLAVGTAHAGQESLEAAFEAGKELYGHVREHAVEDARAADRSLREHPYQALGIVFGAGALIGFMFANRLGGKA